MEMIAGIIVAVLLVWGFTSLKKTNKEINDYYPFDPRKRR